MIDRWVMKEELSGATGLSLRRIGNMIIRGDIISREEEHIQSEAGQAAVMVDLFSLTREYRDQYISKHIGRYVKHIRTDVDMAEFEDWQVAKAFWRMVTVLFIREKRSIFKGKKVCTPPRPVQHRWCKRPKKTTKEINGNSLTKYTFMLCDREGISKDNYYRWDKAEREGGIKALIPAGR